MWDAFIDLMLNGMILLYQALGNNFILALAVFTVVMRLLLLPLNLRQQRSSIRMQEMQPQVQAIQKKYRDNPQKMQEEFAKLGYNPAEPLLGCLPLLIQMPIFFALFRVINLMLESTPQSILSLTERVNASIDLTTLLPIDNQFLWMNLALPDPLLILPVLVAASMFVQQKLLAPPKKDDDDKKGGKGKGKKKQEEENPAAQMTQSMQYTMPLMFGFFAMQFNSGLAIYFIISNVIGIFQGYIVRRSMAEARAEAEVRRIEREKLAEEYLENAAEEESDSSDEGASDQNGSKKNGSGKKSSSKKKSKRKSGR